MYISIYTYIRAPEIRRVNSEFKSRLVFRNSQESYTYIYIYIYIHIYIFIYTPPWSGDVCVCETVHVCIWCGAVRRLRNYASNLKRYLFQNLNLKSRLFQIERGICFKIWNSRAICFKFCIFLLYMCMYSSWCGAVRRCEIMHHLA